MHIPVELTMVWIMSPKFSSVRAPLPARPAPSRWLGHSIDAARLLPFGHTDSLCQHPREL